MLRKFGEQLRISTLNVSIRKWLQRSGQSCSFNYNTRPRHSYGLVNTLTANPNRLNTKYYLFPPVCLQNTYHFMWLPTHTIWSLFIAIGNIVLAENKHQNCSVKRRQSSKVLNVNTSEKCESFKFFPEMFWETLVLFLGLMAPLFYTYGDVCPGHQAMVAPTTSVHHHLHTVDSPLVPRMPISCQHGSWFTLPTWSGGARTHS